MSSKVKSKFLQNDSLIYQLAETIDAVQYYYTLGRDLLGSQAAVSNIIGRTEPNYEEIVFRCLYTWRNANGQGAGTQLVKIFRGVGLNKLATYLERELSKRPNCLSEDLFLQSLTSKIDCASNYQKLGLPLLENNSVKLSNLVGPVHLSSLQYQEALFKVLIRWRNQAGSSIDSLEQLKKILLKNKLTDAAKFLHEEEYGTSAGPIETHDDAFSADMETNEDSNWDESSQIAPLSERTFYDVYLVARSKDSPYFRKMKEIIFRNGWTMLSCFDSKLGVPVLESIQEAVLNCSHVVFIITREDCDEESASQAMTLEMAFQKLEDGGMAGRIIPIFCCNAMLLPLKFRGIAGASIHDDDLEERLRMSINVNIRLDREEEYRSVSEQSLETSMDQPLPLISSSSASGM